MSINTIALNHNHAGFARAPFSAFRGSGGASARTSPLSTPLIRIT